MKLSKEFSRTESRILGALSKLEEFLLNPQAGTCSVAVPGTSRNKNSENRQFTGYRSSDDPCPEVRYFSHHSGHLNSLEADNYPHSTTMFTAKQATSDDVVVKHFQPICQFTGNFQKNKLETPKSAPHLRLTSSIGSLRCFENFDSYEDFVSCNGEHEKNSG